MDRDASRKVVEVCADIDSTKADSDKKRYRLIRLGNGLRALLIHDPSAFPSSKSGGTEGDDDDDEEDYDEEDDYDDDEEEEDHDDDDNTDAEGNEDEEDDEGGQDEGVKRAAAAMAVGVGNLSDPDYCQGLAHYLEHMLFMGSTKYHDENEYDSFISQRGGSSNAFTECEYTLYHFDVLPQHLEKALDIFAQFFVSPLMKEDSSDRELQSIESEFRLSLNNDDCRLQQLWCHTAKRDHPYSKFCWGNMWSLKDLPRSNGVDVRKELVKFHKDHYRASAMQLVVLGGQSLDELQDMVINSFSEMSAESTREHEGVPGGDDLRGGKGLPKEMIAVATAGMPFDTSVLGTAFRLQPVKDRHRLHVTWQIMEQHSLYKKKPCEYLGHLIGHEGEGSVLSFLKHRQWATGVTAGIIGSGYNNSSCCAAFSVAFYLTKAGVRNWLDVVDVLFRYIGMLKKEGPQKWVFKEIRDVANIQYRFQEEVDPVDYVEQLAEQMLPFTRFEDLHILKGPYIMEDWDPELVEDILGQLLPEAARYDIESSLFKREVKAIPCGPGKGEEKEAAADDDDGDDEEEGEDDEEEGEDDEEEGEDDEEEDDDGDDEEEEDEDDDDEEVDDKQFHELCKGSEVEPLQEPRFGLRYWSDAVPREILLEWRSSIRCGGDVKHRSLSLQPRRAPPAGGDSFTNGRGRKTGTHKRRDDSDEDEEDDEPKLALPKPNPFIPSDFDIKKAEPWSPGEVCDGGKGDGKEDGEGRKEKEGVAQVVKPHPKRIVKMNTASKRAPKVIIWHHQDRIFRQPRAEIYLKVVTPVCNECPRAAAMSDLVVRLVNDSLTEYSYAASVAELQYNLIASDTGFEIHVYGFDHKAPKLLKEVLKRLLDLEPHLKKGNLAMQLEALVRQFHNSDMKPANHASNARRQALRKGRWSAEQKKASLVAQGEDAEAGVSLGDVKAFIKRLFHSIEMEALVLGNFKEDDAEDILEDVNKVAKKAAKGRVSLDHEVPEGLDAEFKYPEERVVRLNPSQLLLYSCPSKNSTEPNCALEVYWQIGENNIGPRLIAIAIEQVMAEPLFDQLRTKEQLGYSVGCGIRETSGVLGFCIYAQSAAYGPSHLYSRVRAFMESFQESLTDMEDETFLTQMASAAANKLQPDNSLREEAQRFWPEIDNRRRMFNVNIQEAQGMKELQKDTVLKAYEQWFCCGDAEKPCLVVAVTGSGNFSAEEEASALVAKAREENGGVSRKCVRIATPAEAFSPSDGRDVFPNFV